MRYEVEHITRYEYSQPVGLSLQVAHLRPRVTPDQRCLAHTLTVTPAPDQVSEGEDYFGNPVTRFELAATHRSLTIVALSEVEVRRTTGLPAFSEAWQSVRAFFAQTRWGDDEGSQASEFLFPSTDIPHSLAARDYALTSFVEGRPIVEATRDLMRRIHEDFEFDPAATHVTTPVDTVLDIRRGVCQDFSHLMIACLRAIGLPARYVSGYLVTQPPPGRPRLIGADASHAWVSLYVPGQGWLDFDPTNDLIPGDAHITLGWGRDFTDVSPLRGVIQGGGEHEVSVAVTVTPCEATAKRSGT